MHETMAAGRHEMVGSWENAKKVKDDALYVGLFIAWEMHNMTGHVRGKENFYPSLGKGCFGPTVACFSLGIKCWPIWALIAMLLACIFCGFWACKRGLEHRNKSAIK